MKPKKRKAGRPKLPKDQVRGVLAIRLTNDEREEYKRRADQRGIPLSEWIRETLSRG